MDGRAQDDPPLKVGGEDAGDDQDLIVGIGA